MSAFSAGSTLLDRLLRPGREGPDATRIDLCILLLLAGLLLVPGLGLRDPWPADEPRFVLIARDMLASGDWLVPRVAGEIYAQKPPLYFWLLASSMALTGSLRLGFLLPSLLAGIGTVLLVYDLLRRARGREAALAGALILLVTFQFAWQARQAQIDATLCLLTTLSLYGMLRHLCVAPAPGWFIIGWAAAGLGIITKGVGFLPLLALLPYGVCRARGWSVGSQVSGRLWLAGAAAALGAIGLWLLPMWLTTGSSPELVAYREELLFHQTVTRYADAWHHREPPWYYFVNVMPLLWLPLVTLLPWLWPRWRRAWSEHDTLTAVLLTWVLLVIAFFSASSGKRGVYLLPALPALAIAAAPWLPELLRGSGPRRVFFTLGALVTGILAAAALYFAFGGAPAARRVADYVADPQVPLAVAMIACGASLLVFRVRDGWLAWTGTLVSVLVVTGLMIYPRVDAARSGSAFMRNVSEAAAGTSELGFVGLREQFALQLARPLVHFGREGWFEPGQAAADAALWLAADPTRALVADATARAACFPAARSLALGRWHREDWFLLQGASDPACVARGRAAAARHYDRPMGALNTDS